jgi:HEAT repeat protein
MTDEKYGQSRALDVLNARGLASKREYVRSLEQRANDESLSLLVECLCDDSWYLRDLAEEAFLKLGDRGAEALIPLLERGVWFTRSSAARVLGRLGYRPAVGPLLKLTQDQNDTVAGAARDALVAIGNQQGAVRIAHALHNLPPDVRRRHMNDIATRDQALGERIERMMRNDDLMSTEDVETLSDESAAVRATEEGVEWEILTGPPPPTDPKGESGGERA